MIHIKLFRILNEKGGAILELKPFIFIFIYMNIDCKYLYNYVCIYGVKTMHTVYSLRQQATGSKIFFLIQRGMQPP